MGIYARIGAILMIASSLSAQGERKPLTPEPRVSYGVGVMWSPSSLVQGGGSVTFLPLGMTDLVGSIRFSQFLIEPSYGVLTLSESTVAGTASSTQDAETKRYGLGVLYRFAIRDNVEPYVGARFGMMKSKVVSVPPAAFNLPTTTREQDGTFFAPVLGAQYFLSRHFTLAGEIQIQRTHLEPDTRTPAPTTPSSDERTWISTMPVVMIRWYF